MRIEREIQYALELMIVLAKQAGTVKLPDLCQQAAVPRKVARKVMPMLVRAGLAASKTSHAGGYILARPAEVISAADVVAAIAGGVATPVGGEQSMSPALQMVLYDLREAAGSALRSWTLRRAAAC